MICILSGVFVPVFYAFYTFYIKQKNKDSDQPKD
jgi:hypothetical protein